MTRSRLMRRASMRALLAAALVAAAHVVVPMAAMARAPSDERFAPARSVAGNYLAAVIAGYANDRNAESQFLRQALRRDPMHPELRERAMVAFLANGELRDGFRVAETVKGSEDPEIAEAARLALAVRALGEKRYGLARQILESGRRSNRPRIDPTTTLLTAAAHLGQGNLATALAALEPYETNPTQALADYFAGLLADVAGDRRTAEARLRAASEANRDDLRAADALARHLARNGATAEAQRIYAAIRASVRDPALIEDAAEAVARGQRPPPAARTPQEVAAEALFLLADVGGRGPAAELRETIFLQLAGHLAPQKDLYAVSLAEALEEGRQPRRAIDVYRSIPESSAFRGQTDIREARALQDLGRTDEAIAVLERLVASEPANAAYQAAFASFFRSERRWAEAVAAYDKAIALAPEPTTEHFDLFYGRAVSRERSGDWPGAEADLLKAIALLGPDAARTRPRERADALNYLAYTWVDRNERLVEAFEMLREAVALTEGRNGYIVDSLGWAYFRKGRYEEAVRELEKAVGLLPGDPVLNEHLGDAYWRAGREREARFKWAQVLDLEPEADLRRAVEKKLAEGLPDLPAPPAGPTATTGEGR
jgi:tetratricopeptide (TPR) repeat protein